MRWSAACGSHHEGADNDLGFLWEGARALRGWRFPTRMLKTWPSTMRGVDLRLGSRDADDQCRDMPIGAPKDISECRRFFLAPCSAKQRQYEVLRAYFVEDRPRLR